MIQCDAKERKGCKCASYDVLFEERSLYVNLNNEIDDLVLLLTDNSPYILWLIMFGMLR